MKPVAAGDPSHVSVARRGAAPGAGRTSTRNDVAGPSPRTATGRWPPQPATARATAATATNVGAVSRLGRARRGGCVRRSGEASGPTCTEPLHAIEQLGLLGVELGLRDHSPLPQLVELLQL